MPKTVIDCGNCGPDFGAIRRLIEGRYDAVVVQAHELEGTLKILNEQPVDLVTVNRKLDQDYTDGLDVIRGIKSDPRWAKLPVMLITNYEEYHQESIAAGGVRGFGKLSLSTPATLEMLDHYLASKGPA
jgi:CheY-like chemotaxis protein